MCGKNCIKECLVRFYSTYFDMWLQLILKGALTDLSWIWYCFDNVGRKLYESFWKTSAKSFTGEVHVVGWAQVTTLSQDWALLPFFRSEIRIGAYSGILNLRFFSKYFIPWYHSLVFFLKFLLSRSKIVSNCPDFSSTPAWKSQEICKITCDMWDWLNGGNLTSR